ncbi:MAG: ankyrin repeat domain-containing protein [Saccharofermentanales bacterium]
MINLKDIIQVSINNAELKKYLIHLLKTKKNIVVDSDNNYVLRWSVYYNHIDIVEELLKFDEVNTCDFGYHAFELAIETSNIEIFKLLYSDYRTKKHIDGVFNLSISKCLDYNNVKILKYLLSNSYNVKQYNNKVFDNIIFLSNYDYLKRLDFINILLNDKRFDPSYNNNSVLHIAIVNEKYEYIRLLLKNREVISKIYKLSNRYINKLINMKLIPNYKNNKTERLL